MNEVVNAMLQLLHDTEQLLRTSPRAQQMTALSDFLREFRLKRINPLHQRARRMMNKRFVVSMVGLTNVGKSTLAHALLRHPVAPQRNGPATAMPVEYEHGPEWLIKIHSDEMQSIQTRHFENPERLTVELRKLVFEQTGAQHCPGGRVNVLGPMDLLEGGLVFADTPGYGAAQPHADDAAHEARLVRYLQDHVHEVFFCVSGSQCMVGTHEVEFFRSIRDLCTTVVVTKWDSTAEQNEADIREYRARFSHLFPMCGFLFVEARHALQGHQQNDAAKIEASQVEVLRTLIRRRASLPDRSAALNEQIAAVWEDLCELSAAKLQSVGLASIPWRVDGLARFRKALQAHRITLHHLP